MKKHLILLTAVSLLGTASGLSALSIDYTNILPTDNILVENRALSSNDYNIQVRKNASGTRDVGISFTSLSNSKLDKLTFFIGNNSGASGSTVSLNIYSVASDISAPIAEAIPLYTETGTIGTFNQESYITFSLETPFAVNSGSSYAVVISFVTNGLMNLRQTSSSLGDGALIYTADAGATWTINDWAPLNFVAQAAPVPESGTTALLLSAAIATGVIYFKRRKA